MSGAWIRAACASRGEVSRFTDRLCGVRPRRRIGTLVNEEARTRKRGRAAFERARYGRNCGFGLEQCTPPSHGRRRCEVACKPAVELLHASYPLHNMSAVPAHRANWRSLATRSSLSLWQSSVNNVFARYQSISGSKPDSPSDPSWSIAAVSLRGSMTASAAKQLLA